MDDRLKISEFARLTGVPQKTLRYDPAGDPAEYLFELQSPVEQVAG